MFETLKKAYLVFQSISKEQLSEKVVEGWLTPREYKDITGEQYIGDVADAETVEKHHQIKKNDPTAEQILINQLAQQVAMLQIMFLELKNGGK